MENRFMGRILLAVVVLLAAVFVWLILGQTQQEQRQNQQIQKLKQEAASYEQEIEAIEEDLRERKDAIGQNLITPTVSLCFQVSQQSDLQWVEDRFSAFGWPLTIVYSLEQPDSPQTLSWISQSDLNLELMLSVVSVYEQSQTTLEQMKRQAMEANVPVSPLWFLTSEEFTTETLDLLKQHNEVGFSQPTNYSLSINSGTTEDGLFYVEHVPVQAGDNKVKSSIELTIEQEKFLILSFDVAYIRETDHAEEAVNEALDTLTNFQQEGKLLVDTTQTIYALSQQQKQSQQEQQEAYDKYASEQAKRLDELRKKVDEIYKNWRVDG